MNFADPFAQSAEEGEFPRYFVGTPDRVHHDLTAMAGHLGVKEFIVNTITHSQEARLRSYSLLAEAFALQPTRSDTPQEQGHALAS